jgi:4-amino-4-deoxy-L-arabinose transferase-like glycosyltransferase
MAHGPATKFLSKAPYLVFFLGLSYIIFQFPVEQMAIPYLLQVFLATATCGMSFKIAETFFSRNVGLISVLLLGTYPFVKFYTTTIEHATLITFALTTTLYFLTRYKGTKHTRDIIIAAVALGIALLGRQNNIVLIGAIALWLLMESPFKQALIDIGILCFIVLLTISPIIVRNSIIANSFTPFIVDHGVTQFTMGNLPGAPGHYSPIATHSIESSIKFIKEQPIEWVLLTLRKGRLFFTFPWSPARLHELPLSFVLFWGIFAAFYLFNFIKSLSPERSLLHFSVIFYSASIIITHVEDEYRLPILPVLFIFAAVTIIDLAAQLYKVTLRLYDHAKKWQVQKPAIGLIVSSLVIVAFAIWTPSPHVTYKVDSVESSPLHSGMIIGQNFHIDCPNLNQIAVKMFSAAPDNSVTFHLNSNSLDGPEIFSQQIDTAQLTSLDYHRISFPEISSSAGQNYFFYFDTADLATAEDGIVFVGGKHPFAESLNRIEATPRYVGGAYVNSEELDGNLAFSAHCNASQLDLIKTAVDTLADETPKPKITRLFVNVVLIVTILTFVVSVINIIFKVVTFIA